MNKESIFRQIRDKIIYPLSVKLDTIQELQHQENDSIIKFMKEYKNHIVNLDSIKNHTSALIEQRWEIIDSFDKIRFNNYEFKCRICDGNINTNFSKQLHTKCIFKGGTLIRFECPHCGCITGPLKMLELDQDNFDLDYSQHYSIFSEGDTTEYEKLTFYQMEPHKDKCYLNYGCGSWSRAMEELRIEGYDVFGYEPFSYKGDNSHVIKSLDALLGMRFDGIFSHNVLEHLSNPVETFSLFTSLLKSDDSKMVHSTACYEYLFEFTRFHLFFYTGNSLQTLCNRVGLEAYGRVDEIRNNDQYTSYKFRKS
jgi:hypothetical protein